jgi:subtilisin family serine protease
MTPRRAATLLIVGVVVLVVAAIGFWQFGSPVFFPGPTPTPPPSPTPVPTFAAPPANFTPPPSLEELATQFPELGNVLLDAQLSSAYKDFVVAYQTGGIDAARQLAKDRGLLDEQDRIRLVIELDTTETSQLQTELESNGVQVLNVYNNLMDVAIPLRVVEAAASQENPGAIFDKLTQLDHVVRIRLPLPSTTQDDPVPGEGVKVTGAELWHQAGITGEGIKIGILDLGFGGYTRLLGHGLPDRDHVIAKSFVPGEAPEDSSEIHGAAVAEIVSEMAPGATLYLAYYDGGDVSYGQAVDWLLSQNVKIISHSAGGDVGPMDGSDSDAQVVDQVAAKGVLWVNSSGNEADVHYRGVFKDTNGNGCHEFPDGTEEMGLLSGPGGAQVYLNWDDWTNVNKDYDLYVYDTNGNLVGASEDNQNGQAGEWPVEVVYNTSVPAETTLFAQICTSTGASGNTFDLYLHGYAIEFPVADHSLVSPADARGSFSVGAVDWATGQLVDYSSRGPTADGRMKPEISAPTGVSSASYAPDTFTGTSASAPHVSGAAALVWSANPSFTADDVRNYLEQNAIDIAPAGPDSESGYGALHLPAPPGVEPATVTAAVATQVSFISTAAPAPLPAPGGSQQPSSTGMATTTILLTLLCGGFFLCGFGLVLVGGVALVVGMGRRRPRPAPPPPPIPGAPAPVAPPPTDPVPPPSAPAPVATPRPVGATVIVPDEPDRAGLKTASGKTYYVSPGGVTLGRAPECEIVLDSSQVSRHHATVKLEGASWAVKDLGSSNGTFLNGERLEANVTYRLSPGDELMLGGRGGEKLTFVVE